LFGEGNLMGISLYYEACRERSLSCAENAAINAAIERYPLDALIATVSVPAEEYNGEAFCVYPADADTERDVVFEGATKLPTNSEEAFWEALQYWCQLLSEIRRELPDSIWAVHIDDHDISWDPVRRRYDPST
jgi:hypothetical protein